MDVNYGEKKESSTGTSPTGGSGAELPGQLHLVTTAKYLGVDLI